MSAAEDRICLEGALEVFYFFLSMVYGQEYLTVQKVQDTLTQHKDLFQCTQLKSGMYDISFRISALGKAQLNQTALKSEGSCFDVIHTIAFSPHPHKDRTIVWKILYQEKNIFTQDIQLVPLPTLSLPGIVSSNIEQWGHSLTIQP